MAYRPIMADCFDAEITPLLNQVKIPDDIIAEVIDHLGFESRDGQRRYTNYRDLNVQQLGFVYERLLEFEVKRDREQGIVVQPNLFARKSTSSYFTPNELVKLILKETLDPLVDEKRSAFENRISELNNGDFDNTEKICLLREVDPAEAILELRICDPAMGSGHFLVSLVDYMADHVIAAMAEIEFNIPNDWKYISPLGKRIESIRNTIMANADQGDWSINKDQLDDRHIIRRMVLKRCIFGVDKNPMAVELAKVALWLHTFTVGAPLSFLDHHLRCGDSLFGETVSQWRKRINDRGQEFLIRDIISEAISSVKPMQDIEKLTDAEIDEAERSRDTFRDVEAKTVRLDLFMKLTHAIEWLGLTGREDKSIIQSWMDGGFGDPAEIATGQSEPKEKPKNNQGLAATERKRFLEILEQAHLLIKEENFLNWEVAFPGVWQNWDKIRTGGFDAVIGNPPWSPIKLKEIDWFRERRPEIAKATGAGRKKLIAALEKTGDFVGRDYAKALKRARDRTRMARKGGDYPLLSGGDVNLYSLFVERAMSLVKPNGLVGLLVPSGIASDKTAARFFKGVSTQKRLKALFDFENKKRFFPDVHANFKFCVFVASPSTLNKPARCAFFLHSTSKIDDPEVCFTLNAQDFTRVNPNTGTAPTFRSRRYAELTNVIYDNAVHLNKHFPGNADKAWPVQYARMFDMTNDSSLFRTHDQLIEKEGGYPIGGNIYGSASGNWLPLYVGRMIHQFDHRAASVDINEDNLHRAPLSDSISEKQKAKPKFVPTPQYWIGEYNVEAFFDQLVTKTQHHKYTRQSNIKRPNLEWMIAFRSISSATNARTMIATIVPKVGFGNNAPLLLPEKIDHPEDILVYYSNAPLIMANLNAMVLDFIARPKVHSTNVNWYMVEQFAMVSPSQFDIKAFGPKTAAQIIRESVLKLTYTAHDLAPFARDMGYMDKKGIVKRPFIWNEERRLNLRAKLDAVFFHLYGIIDRDDIRYIYSTFPIVERQERSLHNGQYRSRELCLAWMNALAAGAPDAEIEV